MTIRCFSWIERSQLSFYNWLHGAVSLNRFNCWTCQGFPHHWHLIWVSWMRTVPSRHISLGSIWILNFHLPIYLLRGSDKFLVSLSFITWLGYYNSYSVGGGDNGIWRNKIIKIGDSNVSSFIILHDKISFTWVRGKHGFVCYTEPSTILCGLTRFINDRYVPEMKLCDSPVAVLVSKRWSCSYGRIWGETV